MSSLGERLSVILVRPEKPENIGLVARAMKNTGFKNLRIVGLAGLDRKSFITAVHAEEILKKSSFYYDLKGAVPDLNVILASTAKQRRNFPLISLYEAVEKIFQFPPKARIGLVFGNEITGLTSDELIRANIRFTIPQAGDQPSYNLGSAVLITLFSIFSRDREDSGFVYEQPLSWKEQEESIRMILRKLEEKKFIHITNKRHVTDMVFSLFGRTILTAKDRSLLLALFDKGPDSLE